MNKITLPLGALWTRTLLRLILVLLLGAVQTGALLDITDTPPLLNVPTYSLATRVPQPSQDNTENDTTTAVTTTAMNILTYATPVSIRPDRIWALGLYKGTQTHDCFCQTGQGVLQMLAPEHAPIVKLLGGTSGYEIDKQSECARLGFPWIRPDEENKQLPHLLPNCVSYLQLSLVDNGLVDCGSHQVALCKVDAMYQNESLENADDDGEMNYLDTASLRRMGIITKQGRVAEEE